MYMENIYPCRRQGQGQASHADPQSDAQVQVPVPWTHELSKGTVSLLDKFYNYKYYYKISSDK